MTAFNQCECGAALRPGQKCPRCDPHGVPTGYVPRALGPRVDADDAPDGYTAIPGSFAAACDGCAFEGSQPCPAPRCEAGHRADGCEVVFVKRSRIEVPDIIRQAIDDYLLMERKARAWDELRAFADRMGQFGMVSQMDSFVHPAQTGDQPNAF